MDLKTRMEAYAQSIVGPTKVELSWDKLLDPPGGHKQSNNLIEDYEIVIALLKWLNEAPADRNLVELKFNQFVRQRKKEKWTQ